MPESEAPTQPRHRHVLHRKQHAGPITSRPGQVRSTALKAHQARSIPLPRLKQLPLGETQRTGALWGGDATGGGNIYLQQPMAGRHKRAPYGAAPTYRNNEGEERGPPPNVRRAITATGPAHCTRVHIDQRLPIDPAQAY